MQFRERLIATLRAIRPVLEEPGVLVIGSEVPNLLEPDARATLVVSQDIDLGIPIRSHASVKNRLGQVIGFRPSPEEPSVWLPDAADCIEVNFVGMDPAITDASETYVFADRDLPLLVFGPLSFLRPGAAIRIEGADVPVPRPSGLLLEKLLTDRSAEKGDRDRLVVLALVLVADAADLDEFAAIYRTIREELRHAVRSNLTILSLMDPLAGMPDPRPYRPRITELLRRLEQIEVESR